MSDKPGGVGYELRSLSDAIKADFVENRRVLAFSEYLDLVADQPHRQLRSATQYTRDAFDYFGREEVQRPWGKAVRYKLFDCPWAEGRDRLIGQEHIQDQVYRALQSFVNEGTANKLLLLHGPNGSAKSTLVRCIGRALQHYSTQPEGALYRFNWIFPSQKSSKVGIGFGGTYEGRVHEETYAYLPDEMIDAKLGDELRDHPMFLIPPRRRGELIRAFLSAPRNRTTAAAFVLSDYVQFGQLSHKNRAIYEALLSNYQGDYMKVLRHVQVERFFIQQRYRTGYVTVEPQLAVDAVERQITADRSVGALPSALQSIALYDYGGELVRANRGVIEYSDLLKRPLEAYKYLLTTVERSSVSLSSATLFLDLFYIGTSNEVHLSMFKEIPEFQSFKGRLQLLRVPYLLDFAQEQGIYEQKLKEAASDRHVAPHCAYVAALWAVLTRMRKPLAERYPKEVSDLVARLTPLEKAELYSHGRAPENYSQDQAKELLAHLSEIWHESDAYPSYEGRTGASPREIQSVIFNAAASPEYTYLSPEAILEEIEDLCRHVSIYEFLKHEALPGGYHENVKFIETVRERWLDRVDEQVRSSMGMVEEIEYARVFDRYVTHVIHWTKGEKVANRATGRLEEPDEEMMRMTEETLEISGEANDFRRNLIATIGAWSLDHPRQKTEYAVIFPDHFKKIREAYFRDQYQTVKRAIHDLLVFMTDGPSGLRKDEAAHARATLDRMIAEHGFIEVSARDAISALVKRRYTA